MSQPQGDEFKTITVIMEIDVPISATDEDIKQWVDVEYGECNSMKPDNPCIDNYEVIHAGWKHN